MFVMFCLPERIDLFPTFQSWILPGSVPPNVPLMISYGPSVSWRNCDVVGTFEGGKLAKKPPGASVDVLCMWLLVGFLRKCLHVISIYMYIHTIFTIYCFLWSLDNPQTGDIQQIPHFIAMKHLHLLRFTQIVEIWWTWSSHVPSFSIAQIAMGVSLNGGFSPQIIHGLIGFSIILTIHFGGFPPIFGNTHISIQSWKRHIVHKIKSAKGHSANLGWTLGSQLHVANEVSVQ